MASRRTLAFPLVVVLALVAVLGIACSTPEDPDENIAVSLTETTLSATPFTVRARDNGILRSVRLHFVVANNGSVPHDLLLIHTDLAPDALPTSANGAYQLDGPGTDVLEDLDTILPGQVGTLTRDLIPGSYVLISNEVGAAGADYALGMRAAFTVT